MTKFRRKRWFLPLLILVGIGVCAYLLFQLSKSRTFQFFGGLTARVTTDRKVVALTFDDAPTEYTDDVVDILAEKGVSATFYAVGAFLEAHPAEAQYIVAKGNELGNHSYSHRRLLLTSLSFIDTEIQRTNDLIRRAGYRGEITFRPPNGKKLFLLPWYLKKHNMRTIMWDVEPDTYVSGDTDAIVRYTLEHTKPGSIILMHPFCAEACGADREALPKIIDGLQKRGYRFVTVSELLSLR